MAMTRKDYVIIAEALNRALSEYNASEREHTVVDITATRVVHALMSAYPNFQYGKFMDAVRKKN